MPSVFPHVTRLLSKVSSGSFTRIAARRTIASRSTVFAKMANGCFQGLKNGRMNKQRCLTWSG